ncbi:hypothetical protein AK812_SmicGene43567 [Symbiodinium microadriaticum]|uniref:Uncharacterized protein n=1 Tax=Symbiodinium microadriaticum TaxID=2951 RepID=A0A1Q9C0Q5_SYMMI|nr:hypothetical protein AK812_SmicGene43567 [Symbiodinium microadriaticum]CAE7330966.1 unnamed protein product [Symbiodinium sp. KB8]
MAPKAPNDAKKGREKGEEKGKGKSKGKDEEEEELWALEELFDQAREQLQAGLMDKSRVLFDSGGTLVYLAQTVTPYAVAVRGATARVTICFESVPWLQRANLAMFAYVENNGGSTTKKMGPPNEAELGARMDRVESRLSRALQRVRQANIAMGKPSTM